MNSKIKIQYLSVLVLAAGTAFMFQNCSAVNFKALDSGSNTSLQIAMKACTDSSGASHENGAIWQASQNDQLDFTCVDANNSTQGYLKTDHFLCQNGDISTTASDSVLADPMASCPAPNLAASIQPVTNSNTDFNLLVSASTLHDLKYSCVTVATSQMAGAGTLSLGDSTTLLKNVVEDLNCHVEATSGDQAPLTRDVSVTLDCESAGKIKNSTTHRCEDFQCKQVTALAPRADGTFDVPARTIDGNCYSAKLMTSIPNGPSSLSPTFDGDVISRNHNVSSSDYHSQHAPYVLNKSKISFIFRQGGGARSVKLSGSSSSISAIRVDNFVLVGLAKSSLGLGDNANYRAYGSGDSTIDANNSIIQFRNLPLPFQSFGAGGTASIGALDITTRVSTETMYDLDIRALDCGGSREMSDIVLLFQ
jgi:hypothetical protein